jgi:hypothetical protein
MYCNKCGKEIYHIKDFADSHTCTSCAKYKAREWRIKNRDRFLKENPVYTVCRNGKINIHDRLTRIKIA